MLEIQGTTIAFTRGDIARIKINMTNSDGSPYVLQSGDRAYLTVKKTVAQIENLFQVECGTDSTFVINPIDTKGLLVGSYVYDVQLNHANGDVNTVIVPSVFKVTAEVNYE